MDSYLGMTEDELRQALGDALRVSEIEDDPEALTTRQLASLFGCCEETMRKKVRKAVAAGRMVELRIRRLRKDGRSDVLPAYKFTPGWIAEWRAKSIADSPAKNSDE